MKMHLNRNKENNISGHHVLLQDDLRLMLDSISESIYGVDLNGKLNYCNSTFLRTLGYGDVNELIGKNIHELIHYKYPDGTHYPSNECLIYKALQQGKVTHSDSEVFWRADGTSFPVEYWSNPLKRDGKIIGNVVTFIDISDRKLAEIREKTRNDILELLFKGAPIDCILKEIVLGFQNYDRGTIACIMLRDKDGKHLIGPVAPGLPDFFLKSIDGTKIGASSGPLGAAAFTGKRVVVSDIQSFPGPEEFKSYSGKTGLSTCLCEPIKDVNGCVLGILAIFYSIKKMPAERDLEVIKKAVDLSAIMITRYFASEKLKESEAKYRSLIENSPDIIMTLDLAEKIQFINYTGGGFAREQVVGSSAYNFVAPEFHDLVRQVHRNVISTKKHGHYETTSHGMDGISRRFITNVAPIISGELEQVVGLTLITKDITERKEEEEELAKSYSMLEATLESTADGIMVANEQGRIVRFNNKFAELWKIPRQLLDDNDNDDKIALKYVLSQLKDPEGFVAKVEELYSQPNSISFDTISFKDGRTFERYSQPQMINDKVVGRVWSFRDITESKKAEEEIRRSEEKYRQIVETAQEGIWTIDENNKTSFVNLRMAQMLGYEREEMLGKQLFDFMDEEGIKICERNIERRKQGIIEQHEFKLLKKTGEEVFVLMETNPIQEGSVYKGALAMVMDITQRKSAEMEIMLLMNNTEESFVLIDPQLRIITYNKQFYDNYLLFFGREIRKGDNILDYTHPERKANLENVYKRVLNGERLETEITVDVSQDNTIVYLNRFKPSYDSHGIISGVFVTSIDITERKKVEKVLEVKENRLRTILETEPECIKQLNKNGELIEMNPAGLSMIEADDINQVLGRQIISLVDEKYRPQFMRLTKDVFKGKSGKLEFEITGLKGRHRWLETHAVPLKDANGNIISLLGVTRDITERKKADKELKDSELQLRHLSAHLQTIREEEGTRISREIHDELGQQLSGLKMDASWISRKIAPEQKILKTKVTGMINLIDDTVKTVRRIAAELRPGILDNIGLIAALDWQTNEFVKRTEINCKFTAQVEEINLEKNLATGIFRVYQEALTNITRHSKATEVIATIAQDESNIILTIADNGIGFDVNNIKSTNTLGLIGMKERAIMFGGELAIKSELKMGTTVTLIVPVEYQRKTK